MKLYLGCAEPPFHQQHYTLFPDLDSWTWVDLYVDHPQVKKWDATKLSEVMDNSVEKIYASHLLEHFPHVQVPQILKTWYSKLKTDGRIYINVPDLAWASHQLYKLSQGALLDGYYNQFGGEHGLQEIFYGSEAHEGEYHKSGYISSYLNQLLTEAGFKDIKILELEDAHDMGVLFAEGVK